MATVTMLLAYAPGRPDGDVADRLELRLGLTPHGQIDATAFAADARPWHSLRVLPDGTERPGELVAVETGWALRGTGSEDNPLWALDVTLFRPGDLVTLRGPDGEELVFRVVNVETE